MGTLIQFPENRCVEETTEQLVLGILPVLQENDVDLQSEKFLQDLAVVTEALKSLLHRHFNLKHPMQKITDTLTHVYTLRNGKRITDINYGLFSQDANILEKQEENLIAEWPKKNPFAIKQTDEGEN